MINPETNAIAIGRRLLGMADRIGNSCIPEEIHDEARHALFDLCECRGQENVLRRAVSLAQVLMRFAMLRDGAFTVARAAANLRGAISHEESYQNLTGREAA